MRSVPRAIDVRTTRGSIAWCGARCSRSTSSDRGVGEEDQLDLPALGSLGVPRRRRPCRCSWTGRRPACATPGLGAVAVGDLDGQDRGSSGWASDRPPAGLRVETVSGLVTGTRKNRVLHVGDIRRVSALSTRGGRTSATTAARERRPRTDAQRNRTHILDVAEQYFAEHGITGSLDAIAKRAGVGPGTLYRHFPNREALLDALLTARGRAASRRDAMSRCATPPRHLPSGWMRCASGLRLRRTPRAPPAGADREAVAAGAHLSGLSHRRPTSSSPPPSGTAAPAAECAAGTSSSVSSPPAGWAAPSWPTKTRQPP